MIRDALLVFSKDVRIESRTRVALGRVVPFVVTIVLLFAFALDTESGTLERVSPGLFWVAVLFAANLLIQRSASLESESGISDALRLSDLSTAGIFLGKTAALAAQHAVVEAVLVLAIVTFYGISLAGVVLLLSATAAATIAIAAIGTMYGPLTTGVGARDAVLPLLFLPVVAPILLGATRACEVALERAVGGGWQWVALLGMLALIYLALGMVLWGFLLEET